MSFGIVEGVRKVFEPGQADSRVAQRVVALDDASFTFERGELVSLLGPSGCGKTTLLRIVGGLIERSAGRVAIDGQTIERPTGDYGFVFQTASLMPWRDVLDNVLFPMEILRKRTKQAEERARELLSMVGLAEFHHARPHQLSGGMQQRVALCRALIHRPRLLLMDEPFGALDELTRMEMNDLLLDIRRETGATVLFVTHSIGEAAYLSDRIVVFSRRPARVCAQIDVPLGYPRTRATRFEDAYHEVERRASVALGVLDEPAAPEPTR